MENNLMIFRLVLGLSKVSLLLSRLINIEIKNIYKEKNLNKGKKISRITRFSINNQLGMFLSIGELEKLTRKIVVVVVNHSKKKWLALNQMWVT